MSFDVSSLTFDYPSRPPTRALTDLTLHLPQGGRIALLGPSGCGKSTLLFLLGLLWEPKNATHVGNIVYQNGDSRIPYGDLQARARMEFRRDHFGYVLQESNLLPHFSCASNITIPLALRGLSRNDCADRLNRLLCNVEGLLGTSAPSELRGLMSRRAGELSGGQKQRVAVLRSVIHDPPVVFADEPTSNLDARNDELMFRLLRSWHAGELSPSSAAAASTSRTLIFVCHRLETALRHANHCVVLNEGRLRMQFERKAWEDHATAVNALLGTTVPATFKEGLS